MIPMRDDVGSGTGRGYGWSLEFNFFPYNYKQFMTLLIEKLGSIYIEFGEIRRIPYHYWTFF